MTLKLRVLHGHLKHQDGANAGLDVEVHSHRFVIGNAADCKMKCPSALISPHHCEILREGDRYILRDLDSSSGTFLNGTLIAEPHLLKTGDLIRVGKLEFEVLIQPPAPVASQRTRAIDPVGDRISEMLVEADQEDRARRFEDPAKRRFNLPASETPRAEKPVEPEKKKPSLPPKKPPMKLPPPPKVVADNTVQAAEEVLKKFFERPKK